MNNPYAIVLGPRITEKTMALSYGFAKNKEEEPKRKYTFMVGINANKIQIKQAFEAIYNEGKVKNDDRLSVDTVHIIRVKGKMRRNFKKHGKRSDYKKAIITLKKGQLLEDYGV